MNCGELAHRTAPEWCGCAECECAARRPRWSRAGAAVAGQRAVMGGAGLRCLLWPGESDASRGIASRWPVRSALADPAGEEGSSDLDLVGHEHELLLSRRAGVRRRDVIPTSERNASAFSRFVWEVVEWGTKLCVTRAAFSARCSTDGLDRRQPAEVQAVERTDRARAG